jgi:hypothetical protein
MIACPLLMVCVTGLIATSIMMVVFAIMLAEMLAIMMTAMHIITLLFHESMTDRKFHHVQQARLWSQVIVVAIAGKLTVAAIVGGVWIIIR